MMLLQAEPGFEVTGEARDVRSAIAFVRAQRPDVLVLDLNMPGGPSLPAIPEFLEVSPETSIVVLTMQNDHLIALGHANTEIAGELFLSVRTIESHRAQIQQKLRLSTRAELVRYALIHDLVDLANGTGK
jgi:DNA-binding NarL/FixJ family response regulator